MTVKMKFRIVSREFTISSRVRKVHTTFEASTFETAHACFDAFRDGRTKTSNKLRLELQFKSDKMGWIQA